MITAVRICDIHVCAQCGGTVHMLLHVCTYRRVQCKNIETFKIQKKIFFLYCNQCYITMCFVFQISTLIIHGYYIFYVHYTKMRNIYTSLIAIFLYSFTYDLNLYSLMQFNNRLSAKCSMQLYLHKITLNTFVRCAMHSFSCKIYPKEIPITLIFHLLQRFDRQLMLLFIMNSSESQIINRI